MKYITVDDTVWPVDADGGDDNPSARWIQRYGTPAERERQRMTVASILSAYSALTNSDQSMTDAIAKLKRARQADRQSR